MDRNNISLGDSAVLTLSFQDCSPSGDPQLPHIANLETGGTSTQESVSIIGAAISRTKTFSIELRPTREGNFTIPALQYDVQGVRVQSRALTLNVGKGNTPAPPAGGGASDIAFVRLIPTTNTVYLGQVLPVELQCFCQNNVGNIQLPQFASDNFIIGDIPNARQQPPRVRVGNNVYNLFSFHTTATPIKAGTYALGPATWNLTVFGGQRSFFGWSESKPANITSDTPEIHVLPIPTENAPANYRGAVGTFALAQYEAGPTSLGVGDPITLKIRIAGKGSFDTVTLSTNGGPEWREFKTYPATSKVDTSDPMQTEGSKYFEEIITPLNAQIKEVPAFSFSFFDPESGTFRTLIHAPIPLDIHATAATPQPTVVSAGGTPPENPEQGEEIVHIKPEMGLPVNAQAPLLQQPLFLALQAVPPALWLGALFWRRQKEKLANNPRLRRQRHVAHIVREGVADLDKFAAARDAERFYAIMLRLLQEQLGERLDLPAPAITEAVLDDLPPNRVKPETVSLLHELFHACNQFRYAPEHAAREMTALIPKTKAALHDLQAIPMIKPKGAMAQGVAVVLWLLAAAPVFAQSANREFLAANKLFEEGKFAPAAAAYKKIIDARTVTPALCFNYGNACLKSGHIGRAIAAYRQAEEMSPRDPDIRSNLQAARTQAAAVHPALPGDKWTRWTERLTLNEWTVAAAVTVALFFVVLMIRELSPAFRRSGGTLAWVLGIGGICFAAALGMAASLRLGDNYAVVAVSEAVVRRGPLPESQSLLTLHDGAELAVVGRDGDWLQVSDGARHVGWVAQRDVLMTP